MLDNLEFTARIRPRSINAMGDDLPDDMYHGHTVTFDASSESFDLEAFDSDNKKVRIPLTVGDLEAITKAALAFKGMKAEAQNA